MFKNTRAQQKRRLIILKGVSQDLKHSEIAAQLGVVRWVIMNDLRFMRNNGDLELKQAEKAQVDVRENKLLLFTKETKQFKQNERFQNMVGLTLQEKSFRNMIDFNKHELMKILKSKDQNSEVMKLPNSIRKTLIHNGIITKRWRDNEITTHAQKYLTSK